MRRWLSSCSFLIALAFSVADASGQSFQGGLRGAVKDANGVIPGVVVVLTNEGTNVSRTVVSNDSGEYVFASVTPGTYTVKATLEGFKTFERKGLSIATQQFITLDLPMEVGAISEEVSVTAAAPLIETSNASTGQVLSRDALDTLPNAGRNAFMMATTVPNVVPSGDPTNNRQQDQGNASAVSLGGGPVRTNNYLLDGVSYTTLTNTPSFFPSIEALEEVKVQVNTYDAEMGRTGGGVFNATAKSGTNTIHGSSFLQTRPTSATANDYFSEKAGIAKPDFTHYLWGGSLGGPIVRNKTFFWLSTEDYRDQIARTGTLTFPTAAQRRGDFSQTVDAQGRQVVIYDPLTTRPNPNGTGFIRDPFPGNVIPADRMSTVGRSLLNAFPLPDAGRGSIDGVGNYVRTSVLLNTAWQATAKVEHKFSERQSISGLFAWNRTHEPSAHYYDGSVGDPDNGGLFREIFAFSVNDLFIPNSSSALALRYGYNQFTSNQGPDSLGFDLGGLGFAPSFVNGVFAKKFPRILAEGLGNPSPQGGSGSAVLGDWDVIDSLSFSHNLGASYTKLVGRHSLKIGADYREVAVNTFNAGQPSGQFSFTKAFTQGPNPNVAAANAGSAVASILLGYPSSGTVPIATPMNVFVRYYAGYVQDDFRVSSHLTVNFGVRYEFETGLRERDNQFSVGFDRDAMSPLNGRVQGLTLKGGLLFAGVDGNTTQQGDPSKNNFAPRAGFAWSLDARTVVRGGYGRFIVPGPYNTSGASAGGLGFTATNDYFASADGGLTPAGRIDNPLPGGVRQPVGNSRGLLTGVGGPIDFVDQFRKSGYVHQFSFDFQRELPGSTAASIGYIGSRSENLSVLAPVNINQLPLSALALGSGLQTAVPNPFFGVADAGALASQPTIARGQLLRPYPQFLDVRAWNESAGFARYHSVVLKFERRMRNGIAGRVNYTWSRNWDNLFGQSNFLDATVATPVDNYNLDAEYSPSVATAPHRAVATGTYQLPFGRGRRFLSSRSVAETILGGWQVTAIGTYQSGFPLSISQNNNNAGTFGGGQRPNLVDGVDLGTSGSNLDRIGGWLNPSAFTAAAPFTVGNAPRTLDLLGPSIKNWDFAVDKSVSVGGHASGMIRFELINAFNITGLRSPDISFGRVTFGRIVAQAGFTRVLQLTFRLGW
jgi:trimeric autotransporter adhesin